MADIVSIAERAEGRLQRPVPADGAVRETATILLFTGVWRERIDAEPAREAPSKPVRGDVTPRFGKGSALAGRPPRRDPEPAPVVVDEVTDADEGGRGRSFQGREVVERRMIADEADEFGEGRLAHE